MDNYYLFPFAKPGFSVESPYGPREGGFHTGTDFGLPMMTPVLASADGVVQYAAREDAAGNTVTLRHGAREETRYHHLSNWTVAVGQEVKAGDVIGYSGTTGASTGPHLHFEIRSSHDVTVDPEPLLQWPDAPAPTPPPIPLPKGETMVCLLCEGRPPLLVSADGKKVWDVTDAGNIPTGRVTAEQRAFIVAGAEH